MKKLLIVDGSNLLFQMFFGMPARITGRDGRAIQGTLGFVGALLKIIRMTTPTHVAVIFDGEHENSRKELNADYKANRIDYSEVADEENPFSQLKDIYSALDFMGIRHTETESCEADDLISGYALSHGKESDVIIASFDSDYFQLITDKISVLRYRGDKTLICTPDFIRGKFGISPEQYADLKSLVGDTSDNIKGAEKIGPKTAAALLREFGTLENILKRVESISKPAIRESIIKNTERIKINYRLIKLCGYPSLPFSLDDMKYTYTGITTREILTSIGVM